MKKLGIFLIVVVLFNFLSVKAINAESFSQIKENNLSVKSEVNPGMELLAIMMWFASKYPSPKDSKYKIAVWQHFSKYRNHPSIQSMQKLKFYTDFTENGLLFSDFPKFRAEIPESNAWFKTLGSKENFVSVVEGAKVFAKDSNFWSFYQKHKKDYTNWENEFSKEVENQKLIQTVSSFLKFEPNSSDTKITIYLEPLNNWGAHAITALRLEGREDYSKVRFQIGPSNQDEFLDSNLSFKLNSFHIKTVWHETLHSLLSESLQVNKENISKLEHLFNAKNENLIRQNITNWNYAFEENLVRAIVAIFSKEKFDEENYKKEISTQTSNGFIYTQPIAELIIEDYLPNCDQYENFGEFLPKIFLMLEQNEFSEQK